MSADTQQHRHQSTVQVHDFVLFLPWEELGWSSESALTRHDQVRGKIGRVVQVSAACSSQVLVVKVVVDQLHTSVIAPSSLQYHERSYWKLL